MVDVSTKRLYIPYLIWKNWTVGIEALSFILSERGNIFIADSLTVKTGMLEMYHCPTLKFL